MGDDFVAALTQAEVREEIQVLVDALESPKGDAADRETWEQNPALLEAEPRRGLICPSTPGSTRGR